jgi:stearoyl-CoA desaturase (delta-9 desaturase)
MTRAARIANWLAIVIPFTAVVVAIAVFWGNGVNAVDLSLFIVFYVLTGYGVTLGFHRLLTHKAFETTAAVKNTLAVLGSMAIQGPVIHWVADHRKHHAFTDVDGDPHSPHTGEGSGLKGLWHAHAGWLTMDQGMASPRRYARELVADTALRRISKAFPWLVLLSLALPAALGWALHGFTLSGMLTGLLWGGFVRIFFIHHVTWSINSICHFSGSRRFDVADKSTNVAWLAVPSFGEAWHHNHHAFPRSATHGLTKRERVLDPSAWLIGVLERLGLVWNVVRITPERQAARLAHSKDLPS